MTTLILFQLSHLESYNYVFFLIQPFVFFLELIRFYLFFPLFNFL